MLRDSRKIYKNNGFVLAVVLISATAIMIMALAVMPLALTNFKISKDNLFRTNARIATDAGIDYAVYQLNADDTWAGTVSDQVLVNGSGMYVTFEVNIIPGASDDEKTIESIGKAYRSSTDSSPQFTRTFAVDVQGITTGGTFSIVTGVGGLVLQNSSKIVAGDVFVNGSISMSNTAQIGTTINPVNVTAAHNNCPSGGGSAYPRLCQSSDGQPISLSNSAHIYGDVEANNQTNGAGMSDSGLTSNIIVSNWSSPPAGTISPSALPAHDRSAQIAAVTNTITGNYVCNSNSAQWTLPANTRITGNMEIKKKCEITFLGDVWVEGDVLVQNSAKLIVGSTLTDLPTLMIDGMDGALFENSAILVGNASDIGFRVITYWSAASCSPGCASVTGTDLYNSRNTTTIELQNSASGDNTLFYAKWSQVELGNAGDIGALVGQTVRLTNSATVTFGTSTGGGPGGEPKTWLINGFYKRDF